MVAVEEEEEAVVRLSLEVCLANRATPKLINDLYNRRDSGIFSAF
jgi:hypothetical protein